MLQFEMHASVMVNNNVNSTFATENNKMSAEDNNKASRTGANFRAILDFVMGTIYLGLAGYVVYSRHFGTLELGTATVVGIAALLVIYGGFRIYLGIGRYRQGN